MAGPNQFQYFDPDNGVYFPAASQRSYSQDVLKYDRRVVHDPVVLIQDKGDGSNFAHFAFDWSTRIMHAITNGIVDARDCLFVMGGRKVPFQTTLVEAMISKYHLNWNNFLFPETPIVLDLKGTFTFFSDHRLIPLHPAQMAHPRSVELLRELCNGVGSSDALTLGEKIYVSRDDAKLRRLVNEDEIIRIVAKAGFRSVRMSDYSLSDQIGIIRSARRVIGPHGMGLAHLVFNHGPLGVLELFHPTLGTDAYMMMSGALGFEYHWMVGEAIEDYKGSYRIDSELFEQRLREISW